MIPHDILSLYAAKVTEYGIAILFLVLFIPFWHYVQGGARQPAAAPAASVAKQPTVTSSDWFTTPVDRLFHRGHAWARLGEGGLITVGLDDFAAKLVGRLRAIVLPAVDALVGQGEAAWRLVADDGRSVVMLSPVDGHVVEVNAAVAAVPEPVVADPYEQGWLFKVRPSRMKANRTSLMSGDLAERWMDDVVTGLMGSFEAQLGAVAADGGAPLPGMARALAPDRWDTLAARLLLTAEEEVRDDRA